jgi:hypothetical protein
MEKQQLTTFEKAIVIRRRLLTSVGESLSYVSWSDEFRLSNIQDIHKTLKHWEQENGSFEYKIKNFETGEEESMTLQELLFNLG